MHSSCCRPLSKCRMNCGRLERHRGRRWRRGRCRASKRRMHSRRRRHRRHGAGCRRRRRRLRRRGRRRLRVCSWRLRRPKRDVPVVGQRPFGLVPKTLCCVVKARRVREVHGVLHGLATSSSQVSCARRVRRPAGQSAEPRWGAAGSSTPPAPRRQTRPQTPQTEARWRR